MLSSRRDLPSIGICPKCNIIIRPIFSELHNRKNNSVKIYLILFLNRHQIIFAETIIETVDAGAKIINLSIGMAKTLTFNQNLQYAYDYALRKDVIILVASGNQGTIGQNALFDHPWVIPAASCNEYGRISSESNFGSTIARNGILAPGENIISTYPNKQYRTLSITSFATPFITGTFALLWSTS
jgi:subtilisin family serine protease